MGPVTHTGPGNRLRKELVSWRAGTVEVLRFRINRTEVVCIRVFGGGEGYMVIWFSPPLKLQFASPPVQTHILHVLA